MPQDRRGVVGLMVSIRPTRSLSLSEVCPKEHIHSVKLNPVVNLTKSKSRIPFAGLYI
jgi:hypothetical protein